MEEKFNYATPQRPEGTRPLDADLLPIDINQYIIQIKEEEAYYKNGKNAITVFKSDKVTITLIALKEGESVHPGSETNEELMTLQLINGELLFQTAESSIELTDGKMAALHQPQSFNIKANKESICLLTMIK
jgi:quercetin dioxygenase-like cupin family protein